MLPSMVKLLKKAAAPQCMFTCNFRGVDEVEVVKGLFGEEATDVLAVPSFLRQRISNGLSIWLT